MSRKGKTPIALPQGVQVTVDNGTVRVKGPKGTLSQSLADGLSVSIEENMVLIKADREGLNRLHGLHQALIHNMLTGVSVGFTEKLEMIGVGYRAAVQGNILDVQVGFSHPTKLEIPAGIKVEVEKNTLITISGIDKQAVGQFAAEVRAKRPPEPYQGKGIRYVGEYVRRKAGKAAKSSKKAA